MRGLFVSLCPDSYFGLRIVYFSVLALDVLDPFLLRPFGAIVVRSAFPAAGAYMPIAHMF